ncbi:hypothetical protein [Halorarum halobium]|uniref:hypothetical protein n=1 Tax=Halorarum halobium TaxID=3075121 RepID=UPI0028B14A72|nr:hypothetical protein [Halobaculum sp. XH14]
MKDYELAQKLYILLIGLSVGAGRYIPWTIEIPVSFSDYAEVPIAEFIGHPLVLVSLVIMYIVIEAREPTFEEKLSEVIQESDLKI